MLLVRFIIRIYEQFQFLSKSGMLNINSEPFIVQTVNYLCRSMKPTQRRSPYKLNQGSISLNFFTLIFHYSLVFHQRLQHLFLVIRFVIPVVFIIKLDWSVCICITQLYGGRDMYRIYYIKHTYMFRPFTLAIFRLRNDRYLVSSYTRLMWVVYSGEVRGEVGIYCIQPT